MNGCALRNLAADVWQRLVCAWQTREDPTPPQPSGRYRTDGHRILDPNGHIFVPRGVNIGGTIAANGGGWPDLAMNGTYIQGMKDHRVRAVRIVSYVTQRHSWSVFGKAIARGKSVAEAEASVDAITDSIVAKYRAAGLVVIVEAHDLTRGGLQHPDGGPTPDGALWMGQVIDFWERTSTRWREDSGVWFNIANEPNLDEYMWRKFHDDACGRIRNTAAASNIVVADVLYYASDVGMDYGKNPQPYGYDPQMVPALIAKYNNVVAGVHNYGSFGKYTTEAAVRAHYSAYRDRDVPLIVGEVGFPVEGAAAGTGNRPQEVAATTSTLTVAPEFDLGVLWWASNFKDGYRLYDPPIDQSILNEWSDNVAFNYAGELFTDYLMRSAAA